jgi:hypothetical protein
MNDSSQVIEVSSQPLEEPLISFERISESREDEFIPAGASCCSCCGTKFK